MRILEELLNSTGFYFSYQYDLTNSLERQKKQKKMKVDDRFFWNRFVQQPFASVPANHAMRVWLTPVVQGFLSIHSSSLQGQKFDFVLLSRRSCKRTGTRFESRGANVQVCKLFPNK